MNRSTLSAAITANDRTEAMRPALPHMEVVELDLIEIQLTATSLCGEGDDSIPGNETAPLFVANARHECEYGPARREVVLLRGPRFLRTTINKCIHCGNTRTEQ